MSFNMCVCYYHVLVRSCDGNYISMYIYICIYKGSGVLGGFGSNEASRDLKNHPSQVKKPG